MQPQCPECKGTIFHNDLRRQETSCRACGLILQAPPHHSFKPSGFAYAKTKQTMTITIHIQQNKQIRIQYNTKGGNTAWTQQHNK